MYTIDTLKTNKFKQCTIPSGSELYARFGMTSRKGSYSGDEKPPLHESKIDQVAKVQKLAVENE